MTYQPGSTEDLTTILGNLKLMAEAAAHHAISRRTTRVRDDIGLIQLLVAILRDAHDDWETTLTIERERGAK